MQTQQLRDRLNRLMQPLALLALLLMVLLPGAGRISRALQNTGHADAALQAQIDTALQAFCTQQGLSWQDMQARLASARSAQHQHPDLPATPHHAPDEDCGYCALLSGLDLPAAPALPALKPSLQRALATLDRSAHRTPQITGLGARGPPLNT